MSEIPGPYTKCSLCGFPKAKHLDPDFSCQTFSQGTPVSEFRYVREHFGLTKLEMELLREVASGDSHKELAVKMQYSTSTVKNRLSTIYSKLSVRNKAEAVAMAFRVGLLS